MSQQSVEPQFSTTPAATPALLLEVLPYHRLIVDYLQAEEKAIWDWMAEDKQKSAYYESIRLEILKTTYRLDTTTHAELYQTAATVARKLNLDMPVTFYQSLASQGDINASVFCLPGEAHIVLQGPVLEVLRPAEQCALVGHELGHFKLRLEDQGRLAIADRVLHAIATDERADPSHVQTAINFQLYGEIYADRAAWIATESADAAIGCLVKISTGLKEVNSAAYLTQAQEILSQKDVVTEKLTHPETFIRAFAIDRWVRQEVEVETIIRRLIEGGLRLNALDLIGQQSLTALTRRMVSLIVSPRWMRSDPVLAQARLLFHDFTPPAENHTDDKLPVDTEILDTAARDYLCFLLLDFAAVDPTLEDLPLAYALSLSDRFNLRKRLEELANRELRITKKALTKLRLDGPALLAKADTP